MDATRVLWTGGLDSSFYVVSSILEHARAIEPVYVIDQERRSFPVELAAMTKIRREIQARGRGHLLAPTQLYDRWDFPLPSWIQEAYDDVASRIHIGSQYAWIAAIAEALDWSDTALCADRVVPPSPLDRELFVDPDNRPEGLLLRDTPGARLFQRFFFPVAHLTKRQMLEHSRRCGFDGLLRHSWACHDPLLGRPCGQCRPCQQAADVSAYPPAPRVLVTARRKARRIAYRMSTGSADVGDTPDRDARPAANG